MSEKVPCKECQAMILPSTAEKNDGLCLPCKNGYRESIEQGKEYREREKELDRTCPFRAKWREVEGKVIDADGELILLDEDEKLYYSVQIMIGEIHNGGFSQYFFNSASDHYRYAELALIQMGAKHSLKLTRKAKKRAFGFRSVPVDRTKRQLLFKENCELDSLDAEFYKDLDSLDEKIYEFAVSKGIVCSA